MQLIIHTDGGSRGNPGPAAAGVVIADKHGRPLVAHGYYLGSATNNVAEYEGVLRALDQAARLGATEVEIFCDSELLVRQVHGRYRVKHPRLKPLYEQVVRRLAAFEKTSIQHVRREKNAEADQLVNAALDAGADVDHLPDALGEPAGPATNPPLDLDGLLLFPPDRPFQKTLSETGRPSATIVCLSAGQSCPLPSTAGTAAILCLTGSGTLLIGQKNHHLKRHNWLGLDRAVKPILQADCGENLAILLVGD
ncbi:MAG: ribonuclease HI family protein [Sedimentisphaerales bacterium]|nr:ribonuclease HI family protein [Sedimentisphaerales bacterium]